MRILNLYIYIKEQSLCRHFYPESDVLNVAAHIKNWKYWMEIARILFNSGRFCRYVTMLLSVKNGDRIGFCELSKAGLRLSCFLLFFSSWRWGSREKKRERERWCILHRQISENLILPTWNSCYLVLLSVGKGSCSCAHSPASQAANSLLQARRLAAQQGLNSR